MSAEDLPDVNEWQKWDQKSKEKFLKGLENAGRKKKVWYCNRVRTCDGKPHDNYDYRHARGDQWPPENDGWTTWLQKGGRGSGKTRCGAEWARYMSQRIPRGSIIGPTLPHVRDVMVEGESGILAAFENAGIEVLWEPSKRKITVPCACPKRADGKVRHKDGHFIQAFTGEEPERLRGPQHGWVWLDEPAHYPLIQAVWDNMLFGLRLGMDPKVLCTTTPLPTKWMKELVKDPKTRAVTVSTRKNLDNLAPTVRDHILGKFEGTRMGRQELDGEILEDIEGALWTWPMIENNRIDPQSSLTHKDMERIIVAVDPAGTSNEKSDETGIIVVGKIGNHYYVLADRSGTYSPSGWAKEVWRAFDDFEADFVVAEKNYGGEMVASTLHNVRAEGKVEMVTSRRGKKLRAEPISALYEQNRVHHMEVLSELETQMTDWVPGTGDSPDRVDAMVHGITKLSPHLAPAGRPRRPSRSRQGSGAEKVNRFEHPV